ncbi:MAG: protein translocase subunit SecD [candidate division KSB1 bacterium]|nr:protein translocase subunit SecD [candidate division KSB1 bacterium]MDZ7340334.1 protein translocase subunit SecD [candidate division KSB1 bacterium]
MERMNKSLLYRGILIVLALLAAVWLLYPSIRVARFHGRQELQIAKLQQLTDLRPNEIRNALISGNLEAVVLSALKEASSEATARNLVKEAVALNDKISASEKRAIKRGLDIQGGTFLIYEVDFPNFLSTIAKNPDAVLKQTLMEIDVEAKAKDLDYFDVLQTKFAEKNLPISRYFGKKGDSDGKIISDLRKGSEDAIDRSLQVLRNRIDQFGVSEPSITKQGGRRIVIELAGILDVNRAKSVIGKTAQLEFKLLREGDYARSILMKIDEVVKKRRSGLLDSTALATVSTSDTTSKDSLGAKEKARDEKEVNLDELFGTTTQEKDKIGQDTSLSVDKDLFEEHPFLSLLGNVGNQIAAPKQNMKAVDVILNYPEVKKVIPDESEFLWHNEAEKIGEKEWYFLYLVKKTPEITGEYIEDANVHVAGEGGGSRSMQGIGNAEVILDLNSKGAKLFSRVTGANVGKFLAIVLDGKVASAPRINERIPNGRASITGMRDVNEAKDLVVVLRAGALPAKLESIEERTVGPSLGQDSIRKGQYAGFVGALLVIIFMVIYYKFSGFIADFAVVLNIILILAALAGLHATLTLPGIAGIILTIGMAVDANILIYERIREELRHNKTIKAAIDLGYSRAFITILDANLTTLITALVLYQFGTGPIRGFAVTLSIGLIANMFTAIFVTRFIFDFVTNRWEIKKLSI